MSKRSSKIPEDCGDHAARQPLDSPANKEDPGLSGQLICTRCHAEYREKHWYTTNLGLKHQPPDDLKETLCPGCYRVENHICNGTVILEGPALAKNHDSIMVQIDHVASECWQDNPTSRILELAERDGKIEIKTTTEWLATRIGRAVKRAFKGCLEIKGSPEKKAVSVHWISTATEY